MTVSSDQILATCECGNTFRVKAKAEGRKVRCPKCKTPILIERELPQETDQSVKYDGFPANNIELGNLADPESPPSMPPEMPPLETPAETSAFPTPAATLAAEPETERTPPRDEPLLRSRELTNLLLGLLLSIGASIALLLVLQLLGVSSTKTTFGTTKWEYQIVAPSDTRLDSELQSLGNKGWEVVSARRATSSFGDASYEMILRRPKLASTGN